MEGLVLVFGIGIASLLLAYIAFSLDEKKHFLLQLLLLFFVAYLSLLLPKATLDYNNHCSIVVANSTMNTSIANFSQTTNSYTYFCDTNLQKTSTTFYKIMVWFVRLFATYAFLYYGYMVLLWLKDCWKGEKRDE